MNPEGLKIEIEATKITTDSSRESEKGGDDIYTVFDSSLKEFNFDMASTLPKDCKDISQYLETRYPAKKGHLIGVELGGPGCNLFKDLKPLFSKTVGFTLHADPNLRPPQNHEVIEADVFSRRKNIPEEIDGYQRLEQWVKENGKADLLIERMVGGITTVDIDHFMLIAKRWYKLLSEDGTAFIQFPVLSGDINNTIKTLNTLQRTIGKYRDKFDISYKEDIFNPDQVYFLLRLRKLPDAPDSLDELFKNKNKVV